MSGHLGVCNLPWWRRVELYPIAGAQCTLVSGSRVGVAFLGRTGEAGGVLRLSCACAGQGGPKVPGVTTLTPADQAGGEAGAQVSGIPAQRSGQALRLLVLGTGTSADAVRELAAGAGAEIAQRLSSRVTHVVVDDSVGAEDPRVVRARAAGVPVVGVDEVAVLVGPEGPAGADELGSDDAAAGDGGEALAPASAEAAAVSAAKGVGAEEAGGEVSAQLEVGSPALVGSAADLVGLEAHGARPERVEVGVREVSPLESALVFPPLPPEVIRDGAAVDEEARSGDEAAAVAQSAASAVVAGAGVLRSGAAESAGEEDGEEEKGEGRAVAQAWAGGSGSGGAGAGARAGTVNAAAVTGEAEAVAGTAAKSGVVGEGRLQAQSDAEAEAADEAGAGETEIGAAGAGDARTGEAKVEADAQPTAEASMSASATAVSLTWAVVPLVSLGLLTPVSLGYAAYRLRSRKLAAATAWYTVAVSVAFAISATHPSASDARTSAASGGVLTACLAASWVGGTIHSFVIRRRVFR